MSAMLAVLMSASLGSAANDSTAQVPFIFTVEFDRRHKATGLRAAAVHPGGINTELGRYMSPEALQQLVDGLKADEAAGVPEFKWKSLPQGAATSVWAGIVADGEAVGGKYCEDCHVADIFDGDDVRTGGVRAYALNPERAKALWAKAEAMVEERF